LLIKRSVNFSKIYTWYLTEYCDVYNSLDDAARLIWQVEQQLWCSGLLQSDVKTFAALHQTLLDMSASEGVCNGTFGFTIIGEPNEKDIVLVFEGGIYIGNMHNACSQTLKNTGLVCASPCLYRIFTPTDIDLRGKVLQQRATNIAEKFYMRTNKTVPTKRRNRTADTFKDKLSQLRTIIGNIVPLMSNARNICKAFLVHVLKNNAKAEVPDHK